MTPLQDQRPEPAGAWTAEDCAALETAIQQLERMSFATRMTGLLGRQIESVSAIVPQRIRSLAATATTKALHVAMQTALRSLRHETASASPRLHRALATATGAAGGAFGFASLPVELPLSTVILLRSIADIARQHGEDLSQPDAALACMEVFALGSRSPDDDYMDSSYFAVRALLARTISEATRYMTATAAANEAAPIMVRLITQIAARFGIVVSQKIAAQAIPLIGAAGGAAVNYAFMEHFQTLARGHFTIRHLERKYGAEEVKRNYNKAYASEK